MITESTVQRLLKSTKTAGYREFKIAEKTDQRSFNVTDITGNRLFNAAEQLSRHY